MPADEANPFDRIDVFIAGTQLTARPTEFQYDKDGNPISAIEYETTCPGCGCLIAFSAEDVTVLNGQTCLSCPECKIGALPQSVSVTRTASISTPVTVVKTAPVPPVASAAAQPLQPTIKVAQQGQIIERKEGVRVPDRGCPFQDPIEAGTFSA